MTALVWSQKPNIHPSKTSVITTVNMMRLTGIVLFLMSSTAASVGAALCDSVSKGFLPLTELNGVYKGEPGGLYPGGLNLPPPFHDSAGIAIAHQFAALDITGAPDTAGVWVLLSIGMSNCTQEFSAFITSVSGDTTLHPHLRIIDGAQGGQTASKIKYDTAQFWNVVNNRLQTNNLSAAQVQVVWLKEANAGPTQAFPLHATLLRDDIRDVVRVAKQKYPNLRQVFFSSRTYAGYASTTLNPEPYAYESAFSCRWLLEAQIAGNDSLNFISDSGVVNAPWLAWGPYLWADGIIPRSGDGLTWQCDDFLATDGTHPSASGRAKVATLLEQFFKSSPYTKPWFLKNVSSPAIAGDLDGSGDVTVGDVTFLIAYIFTGGPAPSPLSAGDTDCSGGVDITDATYLIAFIFNGGAPPCGQ